MISVNPQVVKLPDERIGVLVGRLGIKGCIQFNGQRMLETCSLDVLFYHFTLTNNDRTRRNTMRDV